MIGLAVIKPVESCRGRPGSFLWEKRDQTSQTTSRGWLGSLRRQDECCRISPVNMFSLYRPGWPAFPSGGDGAVF